MKQSYHRQPCESSALLPLTAYEAFWFLAHHPKMRCRETVLVSAQEGKAINLRKGEHLRTVKDQMPWIKKRYLLREFSLEREAIKCNLDIFWAKVDERGRVNDDHEKNKFSSCWLEFGPIRQVVSNGQLHVEHSHDIDLDCGGETFDKALIKLARLVRKHYGEYRKRAR